jgi:hypothetical protein
VRGESAAVRAATAQDAQCTVLSMEALNTWMRWSPIWATQIGDRRYDSEIDDLSATGAFRTGVDARSADRVSKLLSRASQAFEKSGK